jgi:hypothetical protein
MLNCAAARASPRATQAIRTPVKNTEILTHATYTRSKKWRFAFQTFTETPTITPSTMEFGITHQPHEGGGWCEMWCEIRRHTLRHHS